MAKTLKLIATASAASALLLVNASGAVASVIQSDSMDLKAEERYRQAVKFFGFQARVRVPPRVRVPLSVASPPMAATLSPQVVDDCNGSEGPTPQASASGSQPDLAPVAPAANRTQGTRATRASARAIRVAVEPAANRTQGTLTPRRAMAARFLGWGAAPRPTPKAQTAPQAPAASKTNCDTINTGSSDGGSSEGVGDELVGLLGIPSGDPDEPLVEYMSTPPNEVILGEQPQFAGRLFEMNSLVAPEQSEGVPAPATLALLGIGLAGLAAARRRKR